MKVYEEISLQDFEFWSGAKDTAEKIEEVNAWDELENLISELYPDGVDEITLNDILWHDSEWVLESLGIDEEEEDEDEEEEEEEDEDEEDD